ncbi:hypothetical protein K501DRAFT_277786 [Backusella circina FSU 941]|nr:hypothetical protein K501DRAFT_277785 [Backusella circina FSU 941]KAI8878143.1 hypothetical protein K501DRAFT_277786 [Backusella circina FSU 941]
MLQDNIQYIFAGSKAITCLHLIQLRRAGLRIIADIEMNTPAAHHHEAIQLTTDTELDKLYPCFTFNSAHISSPKQSDHLSLSAHHLFESACGQTCIVCLEDFIEQESVLRELPCHHFYHKSCIVYVFRSMVNNKVIVMSLM